MEDRIEWLMYYGKVLMGYGKLLVDHLMTRGYEQSDLFLLAIGFLLPFFVYYYVLCWVFVVRTRKMV